MFHCHDWQAALVPVLLQDPIRGGSAFRDTGTVFTIHNMGYQGLFPPEILPLLTLPWDLVHHCENGIFRQREFPEGRAGVFGHRDDSKPQVQPGNPDDRIWLWPRRCAEGARANRDRHPEWRRLRRMEPGNRQIHRRTLLRRRSDRANWSASATCWQRSGLSEARLESCR